MVKYGYLDPQDIIDPKLAEHQQAIGRLCNEWAVLEMTAFGFFVFSSGMPQDNTSLAIAASLPFRDVLAASKIAAASRFSEEKWIDLVVAEIDYISNQLRPERNRLVHDQWGIHNGVVTQCHVASKLYKPQSHTHRHLQVAQFSEQTVDHINKVSEEIKGSSIRLEMFSSFTGDPSKHEIMQHLVQPKRLLPLPQSEMPRQLGVNVRVR